MSGRREIEKARRAFWKAQRDWMRGKAADRLELAAKRAAAHDKLNNLSHGGRTLRERARRLTGRGTIR